VATANQDTSKTGPVRVHTISLYTIASCHSQALPRYPPNLLHKAAAKQNMRLKGQQVPIEQPTGKMISAKKTHGCQSSG